MALIDKGLDALLVATIRNLGPYLDDLVVIGGVANALLRHHPLAADTAIPILGTTDIDIATPERLQARKRPALSALLEKAGLTPAYHPEHSPPIIKFVAINDPNLEVEFLCPLTGGEYRRSGKRKVVAAIQPNVTAQQLRYLDVLLFEPWAIDVRRIPALKALPRGTTVRVPNPASYVMQKVLIRTQNRAPASCDKDCGYIYEVAVAFRDALPEVGAVARRLREHVSKGWWRRFDKDFRRLFADEQAPGPVAAARQHAASRAGRASVTSVSPALVHQAVERLAAALL
jgi:hypothetical protein